MRTAVLLTAALTPAVASPPQPQPQRPQQPQQPQPQLRQELRAQLRGAANASATLWSGSATKAHFVWKDRQTQFCLSSDGNRVGNGVKVQLWECDQTWKSGGQNFFLDRDGRIRAQQDPSYCMVVDGDDFKDGAKVQLWKCDAGNSKQLWQFWLSGQIQSVMSPSPMCVAVDGNRAVNGAKVQVWSCTPAVQDFLMVSLSASGRVAYAAPDEDKACASPFEPVSDGMAACAAAAEAIRPGSGCQFFSGPLLSWSKVVREVNYPTWPQGCSFYSACQGGCSLYSNPSGMGASCPTQGSCMSISVICQMAVP